MDMIGLKSIFNAVGLFYARHGSVLPIGNPTGNLHQQDAGQTQHSTDRLLSYGYLAD